MKRLTIAILFTMAVALSGGIAFASTDAGPVPDVVKDAPAPGAPASAAPYEPDLGQRLEALQKAYDALKAKRAPDDAVKGRAALWAFLLSGTLLLLALAKMGAEIVDKPGLKRWLPYVAFGLAVLSGFLDAKVAGGTVLQAMLTGTGPGLAVLIHEMREGWTGKRALAYAQAAAAKPPNR